MVDKIQILRSSTFGNRPAVGAQPVGAPYVNFGGNQFGVIDPTQTPRDLIGVPFFSTAANYTQGQPVNYQGNLYIALASIAAGAWNSANWSLVATLTSPAFVGTPTAPTPAAADNSTKLATTAFVAESIPANTIKHVYLESFLSSGTWTPRAGMVAAIIECVGGGGGGGGANPGGSYFCCGGGGAAGSYSRISVTAAQVGASQSVTVGAQGTGGPGGGAGTAGGTSSVGSLCIANGGNGGGGGTNNVSGQPGQAGSNGTGTISWPGEGGYPGLGGNSPAAFVPYSPKGGSSIFGAGGAGQVSGGSTTGGSASGLGGGGGGGLGNGSPASGGYGLQGGVFITEYVSV